jgi:dTDP-4-amino-4,6-dideoxygalactose transaminase
MKKIRFPLIKPYIESQELKEVARVLKSGWFTQGRYAKILEEKIKDYNRVKYAFLLNSATSGLIVCVRALNLNKKDKVIVPSFTFPATVNSIILAGATPIFCDIDLATFNISVEKIEKLITKDTKAIMVVHEFGLSADMAEILRIAQKHNLSLIEDAACSLGAEYNGRKVGIFGDFGIFSFHPRKVITCGEGGCVITNSGTLAKKIEIIRNHGEYNKKFVGIGYNFRLTDIQAAILLAQFKRIEKVILHRIKIALTYNKLLKPLEEKHLLKVPFSSKNYRHIYQSYVILLSEKIDRDKLKNILRQKGIETQFGAYCIPLLDFYRRNFHLPKNSFKNAYFAYKYTLTLPLYHTLDIKAQKFILEQLGKSIIKCAE